MNQEGVLSRRSDMDIKRHVACKVGIKDLLEGRYVKEEGEFAPNYVLVKGLKIARANVIGVIVAAEDSTMLVIDDGSARISLRFFGDDQKRPAPLIGSLVMIIGRPRQFGEELYIVPEIIKTITNRDWMELRRTELKKSLPAPQTEIEEISERPKTADNFVGEVIQLIREGDTGDGADIQEIISKVDKGEDTIMRLLKAGEIFEIRPGKLKILE